MKRSDALDGIVGPLEADILRVMWATGDAMTPRDVLTQLNARRDAPLAYTTVMTVMARLAEKDILRRTPLGRGYVYEPVVHDAAEIAVRGVMRDFGDAAVAHFVSEARADPKLRRRLQGLLRED